MTIPVYTYIVFTTIIETVNIQDEVSITIKDLFNATGTIIITIVVLYYLYIYKIYDIYTNLSFSSVNINNYTSSMVFKTRQSKNVLSSFIPSNENINRPQIIEIKNIEKCNIKMTKEDDIINGYLNNKNNAELIINIKNGDLIITNNINLNNNNIKKLKIIGESKDYSILNFSNINNGFIFGNSIKEIELSKISINGNLKFMNNNKVEIGNVNINGILDFNSQCFDDQCIDDQSIIINNLNFHSKTESKEYCINLFGNVKINNSFFYGNSSCKNGIMKYDGEHMNNIEIIDSYFNGEYLNQCFKIINSLKSEIISSKFEKGASYKNGGLLYIYSSSEYRTNIVMFDTEYSDVGNINQPINNGGLIASVEGFSNLYIKDFYGENLNGGNGVGAFTLNQESTIEINNIELHGVDASGIGGVFFTSSNEAIGSKFKITNGNFKDFIQNSVNLASSFIMVEKNIDISINNPTKIEFNNVSISNYTSFSPSLLFKSQSINEKITYDYGEITISNSYFSDIWRCMVSDYCVITNRDEILNIVQNGIIDIGNDSTVTINNTTFEFCYSSKK
ncbi:hypothetical protein PIROE2DRAFT_15401 [Piromyces sp. E2]|nr:hypothetical protein PIROE2DRAFT_15401 [Piromyces sp. E2]|eukprot:OUM59143.1 hypothetical protein PIROE2DRAFT_15401 [Piromyces sp. E2]